MESEQTCLSQLTMDNGRVWVQSQCHYLMEVLQLDHQLTVYFLEGGREGGRERGGGRGVVGGRRRRIEGEEIEGGGWWEGGGRGRGWWEGGRRKRGRMVGGREEQEGRMVGGGRTVGGGREVSLLLAKYCTVEVYVHLYTSDWEFQICLCHVGDSVARFILSLSYLPHSDMQITTHYKDGDEGGGERRDRGNKAYRGSRIGWSYLVREQR